MNDYQRELMNDRGYIQETVFDGGNEMPNTSVYKTWEDYDSGNPMGSYSNSGGYQSQFGKWADAFSLANKHKQGTSGYQGGWAQPFAQGSGANVTQMGDGKWMHQFEPGKIAGIVHHPQKQKSKGFFGTVGSMLTAAGSAGLVGPWGTAAGIGLSAIG